VNEGALAHWGLLRQKKYKLIIHKDTDHSKNWNGVNKMQGKQVAKIERCVKVRVKMSLHAMRAYKGSGSISFESQGKSSGYPLSRGLAEPQSRFVDVRL
jgi:hypothetical protein